MTKRVTLKAEGSTGASTITPLHRELDGTVYAYHCNECGGNWKVYQQTYHSADCSKPRGLEFKGKDWRPS